MYFSGFLNHRKELLTFVMSDLEGDGEIQVEHCMRSTLK